MPSPSLWGDLIHNLKDLGRARSALLLTFDLLRSPLLLAIIVPRKLRLISDSVNDLTLCDLKTGQK